MDDVHVIKLGGSLLDLPDVIARLEVYRRDGAGRRGLLVVGGAEAADVVRRFDAAHHLSEAHAHWLAIRAMQFNAHVVAAVLARSEIVLASAGLEAAWQGGHIAIIDPLTWLRHEESQGITIPHRWTFTSDSIAAHVAVQLGAEKLTLLKSTLPARLAEGDAVKQAVAEGLVDADFEMASQGVQRIEIVNLRHESLAKGFVDVSARCALR